MSLIDVKKVEKGNGLCVPLRLGALTFFLIFWVPPLQRFETLWLMWIILFCYTNISSSSSKSIKSWKFIHKVMQKKAQTGQFSHGNNPKTTSRKWKGIWTAVAPRLDRSQDVFKCHVQSGQTKYIIYLTSEHTWLRPLGILLF